MAEKASRNTWHNALAVAFDVIMLYFGGGYLVALATGNLTKGGFSLEGWYAVLWLALTVAYFWVFTKYLGGTIWQRILRVR